MEGGWPRADPRMMEGTDHSPLWESFVVDEEDDDVDDDDVMSVSVSFVLGKEAREVRNGG